MGTEVWGQGVLVCRLLVLLLLEEPQRKFGVGVAVRVRCSPDLG